MKIRSSNRVCSLPRLMGIVAGSATLSQVHAFDKTWVDAAANNTWDTIATNTWTDAIEWDNQALDTAVFGGISETVTLGEPITAGGLTFNSPGYLLTGGILTLSGGSQTIQANANVRIDSEISVPAGRAFVRGTGTVTLGGVANFPGDLRRYAPSNSSGSLNVVDAAIVTGKSLNFTQDNVSNYSMTYNQTGGSVTLTGSFGLGFSSSGGASGGTNTANISGGTLTAGTELYLYKWANSILNISNAGVVNAPSFRIGWTDDNPFGTINLGDGANFSGGTSIQDGGTSGILNVVFWDVKPIRHYTLNFKGGTLQAGGSNASLTGSNTFASIAIQEAGGIIDNNSYDVSYAQSFSHGGAAPIDGGMVFKGSGITTLNGNTYTGPTTIEAGTVRLTNSVSSAAVTILDGASLAAKGTIGHTTLGSGSTLEGGVGGSGTLITGNLTIGASAGSPATLKATTFPDSIPLSVQGVTLYGGNGSVKLDATIPDLIDGTTYDVMSYTSLSAPGASTPLAVFTTPMRVLKPIINSTDKKIQVMVDLSAGLEWTGAGSSAWSTAPGLNNWKAGGNTADFIKGDFVTFGNAPNTTVEVDENVEPSLVVFDNDASHNYLVTGGYGIDGTTSFTKRGAGKVVMTTTNSYTGPTVIEAGTLQIGDATLNGRLSPDSSITTDGIFAIYNETGMIAQGTDLSSSSINGTGSLLKGGAGTLLLNTSNSYEGGTTVSQGTLELSNPNAAGEGAVTLGDSNTGSADVKLVASSGNSDYNIPIIVSASGTGTVTISQPQNYSTIRSRITLNRPTTIHTGASDRAEVAGKISGNVGTLTFSGNRVTLGNSEENASDFTGDVVVDGQAQVNTRWVLPPTASVIVNSGKIFRPIRGADIDALMGSGTTHNASGRSGSDPMVESTLTVGNNGGSGDYAGVIRDGSGNDRLVLTKRGAGNQILSGANTYTGVTTVEGGTLQVNGTNSGTGAVIVKPAATLAGSGSIAGSTTIESGAFVAPGGTGIGTLTVASATLAGTYECQLDGSTGDTAVVTGSLTIQSGGAIHVSSLTPPTAASYIIATYGSMVGTPPAVTGVPGGYEPSFTVPGEIRLVSTANNGYNAWANGYPDLSDSSKGGDPDKDGVVNIIEYVIGGDPRVSSTNFLPKSSKVGGNLVLSYKRSDASELDTTQVGQWSTGLGIWTDIVPVLVNENGTDPDDMEIRIPLTNEVNGKLFGRLYITSL